MKTHPHYWLRYSLAATLALPGLTSADENKESQSLDALEINSYVTERSLTGSKTDLPIREIPQSLSVVSQEQIEIQGARSLDEALSYTAGVVAPTGGARRNTDQVFTLRGFADRSNSTIYVDGTKVTRNIFSGTTETYGIDKIEVLKGPASALYGRAAPGGIINVITKKPSEDAERELQVQVGTNSRRQLAGDIGGALDSEGKWLFRLVGLARDSETDIDYIDDDRRFFAPSLLWQPTEDTSITVRLEYQKDETAFSSGLPTSGTVERNPNGSISPSRFVGEPDYDDWESKNKSFSYQLEHAFSDTVKLRQNFHKFQADVDYRYLEQGGYSFSPNQDSVFRVATDRVDDDKGYSIDTNLEINFANGAIENQLLIGFDITDGEFRREQLISGDGDLFNGAPNLFNLYNPVYGNALNLIPFPFASSNSVAVNELEQRGIYLQNRLKIGDHWSLSTGVRRDDVTLKSSFVDRSVANPVADKADEDSDETTFNVGIVYLAENGLSPYFSYSESFQPNVGLDNNGDTYEPSSGEQFEIGLKYRPEGGKIQASIAIFELEQKDAVVFSSLGIVGGNQIGIDSKGVELETQAQINSNLNVIASYAYIDAEVASTDVVRATEFFRFKKGNRTAGQPKNALSVWMDYRLPAVPGLTLGGGLRYYDDTTNFNNDVTVSSYTLTDFSARYDIEDWRLALNIRNLTDKEYVSGCTYACWYGEGRSATATLSYIW